MIFQIWTSQKNHEKSKFSSALIEKTKSRMKKFSRAKNAQNHPKN